MPLAWRCETSTITKEKGPTPFQPSGRGANRCFSLDDAEDVALLHDEQLLAVNLDLGARPFAEQDPVTLLDVEGHELAVLVARTGAGSNDLAQHRLFLRGVGNDDAAGGLHILFDATHNDAVMERAKLHGLNLTVAEPMVSSFGRGAGRPLLVSWARRAGTAGKPIWEGC